MTPTKNARRLAVLLAVPALFLATSCSSDSGGDSTSGVAKVSGKFGAKPKVTVPKGEKPAKKSVIRTLTEGSGPVIRKGDYVRLDFMALNWKNSRDLGGTWTPQPGRDPKAARQQAVEQAGEPSRLLPKKVFGAVLGKKAGSRLLVQGTAKSLVGTSLNPQSGLKQSDTLVWVVDVAGGAKVDKQAEAKGKQAEPAAGMPEVKANKQKPATITIPKGAGAPKELRDQVLIKGGGPRVKAGQGLIGQYTGVAWEDGKKFDSSWDHGGAAVFQIGTGSVVKGWDEALVGKNVGDRVLLVVPPKKGYGSTPGSPLAKKTLVFSVDIIGTV